MFNFIVMNPPDIWSQIVEKIEWNLIVFKWIWWSGSLKSYWNPATTNFYCSAKLVKKTKCSMEISGIACKLKHPDNYCSLTPTLLNCSIQSSNKFNLTMNAWMDVQAGSPNPTYSVSVIMYLIINYCFRYIIVCLIVRIN